MSQAATRRRVASTLCVVLLTGGALVSALRQASADSSSSDAARLVEHMRAAPRSMQFSGVVRVTWRTDGRANDLTVEISDDKGSIEVQSGSARVFDVGDNTYFKTDLGWSSALIDPPPENLPSPDHRWSLGVRTGPTILGRPTQLVEATRRNGTPVLRMYIDTRTNLLLRRQVLDAHGRVERSLEFVELTVASGPELRAPAGVGTRKAIPLDEVPDGYHTTGTPSGYVLVGRSRHQQGVQLLYTDGLFSVTVLEQHGELDWDAVPRGGVGTEVGGHQARRYTEPGTDVMMWQHDGTVFTAVTDAPSDVVDAMIAGFSPDRSTAEKVVDFVLGPFGWS